MLGLPWQSRQHRCVCTKLVILPSPTAQQLFFLSMALLFCRWLIHQAAGKLVNLPQPVSIQICSSHLYLTINFWEQMQHFWGEGSDRDHTPIHHLSSQSKGQVALWSSASTKNRISLFAMSAFQQHSVCFFPLTEFTFCSGKGYIHPPSVSMCFFLISSLCKLMGVIVASVRSHWGSGFPGSHRQAREDCMVAAALGGSTDMHA